jgi:uncharacterized sporulation protein YeaH/YhbH (DUF444 family)
MSTFIDRRLNGKNRSSANRRKFTRRAKEYIKEAVDRRIGKENIKDIADNTKVKVKKKTIQEPTFQNSKHGKRQGVHPGNEEYFKDQELLRPKGGAGGGGKQGGESGDAEDEFIFSINRKEFLEYFFEGLALPDLIKTSLLNIEEWKWKRAGYTTDGSPANLNIVRSFEASLMRREALEGGIEEEIKAKKKRIQELEAEEAQGDADEFGRAVVLDLLYREVEELVKEEVPFIDDIDIRYNVHTKEPNPSTSAVMFCVLDVSVSMGEFEKMLSKKFFFLLYLFLEREYEEVEIHFIRYHHEAEEVDEEDFWTKVTSGGTVTSTALKLVRAIIQENYATADWNIYLAHASDGDNFTNDRDNMNEELEKLLPMLQYYAYVQVGENIRALWNMGDANTELWNIFEDLQDVYPSVATALIEEETQIWPVFRRLFEKRESAQKQ